MGGKRQAWDNGEWDNYSQSYAGWGRQGQAAKPQKSRGKGKDQDKSRWAKDEGAFPTYEDIVIPQRSGASGKGRSQGDTAAAGAGGRGGLSRQVQRIVNNLRRSETRLRKITEEEEITKQKWAEFQVQLKNSFIKERSRYYENMERLKAELEEQTELQEEALDELQKALANPGEDRMDVEEIPSAAHQDWDTLLAEAERVEDLSTLLSGTMCGRKTNGEDGRQRLLRVVAEHRAQKNREQAERAGAGTRTPPRRERPAEAMTPPPRDRPLATRPDGDRAAEADAWLEGARDKGPSLLLPRWPAPCPRRLRSHPRGPALRTRERRSRPIRSHRRPKAADLPWRTSSARNERRLWKAPLALCLWSRRTRWLRALAKASPSVARMCHRRRWTKWSTAPLRS